MKHLRVATTLSLLAGFALPPFALAQQIENNPSIYAGGVAFNFDHSREQHDDRGYLIGGEFPLSERWSTAVEMWEVDSDRERLPLESEIKYYRLGGNYHLDMAANGWQPYLSAAFGYFELDPNDVSGTVPQFSDSTIDLGFGFKRHLIENFFVRTDVKTIAGLDEDSWDFTFGLSLAYVFGGNNNSRPVASGPAPAAPLDSDDDGVPDNQDQCRNTPAGTAVDARGCELDSDRDGVADSRDNCPNTSIELAVDANGCPILEVSQRRQELLVNFDFDQAVVRPEYADEIEAFADFMTEYGNTSVVIEGHTDSVGTQDYNQGLSERRANAVMNVLIQRYDIPAGRLSAVGYGEDRPVATNDTAAGRERNRRIEAEVSVQVEEARRR